MSRIKQKKQGVVNSLVFTQQDNTVATISYDGTDFDFSAPASFASSVKFLRPVVTEDTAATYTITAAQSGTTFVLAKATGIAFTLPTAAAGLHYTFFVSTTASGGSYTIATDGTDNFEGVVLTTDKDQAFNSTEALQTISTGAGTATTITMNGTTQGGIQGSCLEVTAINSDRWLVRGTLIGDGNLVTIFS